MSIADFKGALKDAAYKEWFNKSMKSIFIQTTDQLRPTETTAQKTSFLITEKDIKDIGEKLSGRTITDAELVKIKTDMVSSVRRNRVINRKDSSLFFPVIGFKTGISNILEKGFSSITKKEIVDEETGTKREARISDFYQKGHVVSIASNIAEQTKRNLQLSKASDTVKELFIPILEEYIKKLKEDDLATSNIGDLKYDLYAKYSKNPYKYIVEMQLKEKNRSSGIASAPLTHALRRYFTPGNVVEIEKYFRTRSSEDSFIQKLITAKGSPSFIDLITSKITNTLKGVRSVDTSYLVSSTLLDTVSIKVDTSKANKAIKNNITEATRLISNIKKAASSIDKTNTKLRNNTGQFYSLTSLQKLINDSLQHVISANMGDGSQKKILNYRTGRFATSAAVTGMSQSRAGMITAFYTYMKNPYQTFEPGYAQGSKTRDPKLLITKSIKEIAVTKVANRMRAVLV